jgi:hypothetical protein
MDWTNQISWSISYVHRSSAKAGNKAGIDYEKEIKRVATFGSVRSTLEIKENR